MRNSSKQAWSLNASGAAQQATTRSDTSRRWQRAGMWLVAALLSGCQGTTTNNDPNLRPVDARRSLGNPAMGAVCNDQMPCPKDTNGNQPRCASVRQFDAVGFCAPECRTDADCDTTVPGLARCTNMSGKAECVLFCDQNRVQTSKLCPDGWTCEPIQTYFTCVPPQRLVDGGT
jgi:hypothetical protein